MGGCCEEGCLIFPHPMDLTFDVVVVGPGPGHAVARLHSPRQSRIASLRMPTNDSGLQPSDFFRPARIPPTRLDSSVEGSRRSVGIIFLWQRSSSWFNPFCDFNP